MHFSDKGGLFYQNMLGMRAGNEERTTRTGLLLSGLWCAVEQGWEWWSEYLFPIPAWRIRQSSDQPLNVSPTFSAE